MQFVEKIVVIPEVLTVQGAPVSQVAQAEKMEFWRSERLFPQNLHYPSWSRHLSWKFLQLLWDMYNPLPCGVRGARTLGHVTKSNMIKVGWKKYFIKKHVPVYMMDCDWLQAESGRGDCEPDHEQGQRRLRE